MGGRRGRLGVRGRGDGSTRVRGDGARLVRSRGLLFRCARWRPKCSVVRGRRARRFGSSWSRSWRTGLRSCRTGSRSCRTGSLARRALAFGLRRDGESGRRVLTESPVQRSEQRVDGRASRGRPALHSLDLCLDHRIHRGPCPWCRSALLRVFLRRYQGFASSGPVWMKWLSTVVPRGELAGCPRSPPGGRGGGAGRRFPPRIAHRGTPRFSTARPQPLPASPHLHTAAGTGLPARIGGGLGAVSGGHGVSGVGGHGAGNHRARSHRVGDARVRANRRTPEVGCAGSTGACVLGAGDGPAGSVRTGAGPRGARRSPGRGGRAPGPLRCPSGCGPRRT